MKCSDTEKAVIIDKKIIKEKVKLFKKPMISLKIPRTFYHKQLLFNIISTRLTIRFLITFLSVYKYSSAVISIF